MNKIIYIYVCVIFSAMQALGQQVTNISAEFDDRSALIIINYDLISYSGKEEKYQVRAFYSLDNGDSFIPIKECREDVGDGVSSGTGKKILWDYFIDNPDFTGKDVIFKVEAKWDKSFEINRLRSLGGAESALNSLLVPSWGHRKVSNEKQQWWTTALIYGITGAGLYFTFSANDQYQQYKNAQNASEAADLLDKANQQGQTALILLGSGITLWASNMLWVGLRGAKNKRRLNDLLSTSQHAPILLGYDARYQSIGLQLKFKF